MVLLYGYPENPFAQPKNIFFGHLLTATVGVVCLHVIPFPEYIVINIGDKKTSGIAAFSYYPKELKPYMIKIDCFCYDTHTLEPGEKRKFVLTMMIDPKVTKDSKTKSLEEGIMQFIFFESENFKQKNS